QPVSYFESSPLDKQPPEGFVLDDNRVFLGSGEQAFQHACDALRRWEMYPQGWIKLVPHRPILQAGAVVMIVAKAHGVYWKSACRVVETFDQQYPAPLSATGHCLQSFGFVYATLPGHVECGQERFLIVRDAKDQVWYEIRAFSKPQHWLAKIAYPLVRRLQKRFFAESMSRMVAAVEKAGPQHGAATTRSAAKGSPIVFSNRQ
ncbi:MAG: DUF1990 domain-containing protein, partial [Lacipirellulaceae bacterium]